jgi:putative heme-binding domain-containing protein
VYREAAWPAEYQGNLFFCEWGKSALRRFVLRPKGGTFEVALAEDFVTAGDVRPFKPFDVCESPDGRFLYFSDWAYEGWTAKVEAGRLWRLRRADDDPRTPSRLAPMPATPKELGAELASPGYRRRAKAQRALATMGDAGLDVTKPIAASSRGSLAQPHAIWAVAEVWHRDEPWKVDRDSQPHSTDAWIQLLRAQLAHPGRVQVDLEGLLIDAEPRLMADLVRAGVAHYLRGGSRDQQLATLLSSFGPRRSLDAWDRFRILRALRDTGLPVWNRPFAEELAPEVLAASRDSFDLRTVERLRSYLPFEDRQDRALVLETLASCARKEPEWDGKWWNIQPAKTPPPRRTVDWEGTPVVLSTIRRALGDREASVRCAALRAVRDLEDRDSLAAVRSKAEHDGDPSTRMLALDVLGALKDEDAAPVFERVVRDPSIPAEERQHAIEAACAIRTKKALTLLRAIACDTNAAPAQSIACIEALARVKDADSAAGIEERARSGAVEVRRAALAALARIQGREAGPALAAQLADPAVEVRTAACRALAEIGDERQVEKLLPLACDPATRSEAVLALARTPTLAALSVFLDGVAANEKRVVDASQAALLALRDEARAKLEELHRAGALGEKQLAAVQQALQAPQPVLDWHVLGPFDRIPTGANAAPIVLERGTAPPSKAAVIDPEQPDLAARHVGRKQAEFGWRPTRAASRTGFVDLREVFDGFDEVTAFAFARVRSSSARRAKLLVGSDDMVRVWLNGVRVHAFDGYRAWTEDEDTVEVDLRAGENALLVQVSNGGGGWSFDVKLTGDPTGPLFERRSTAPGVDDYRAHAIDHAGDPQKGYALFRKTSGPMCIRCHTVYGEGAQVGPDLSDVAAKYGRDELLRSLLEPSQRIAEGYNGVTFELEGERLFFGQVQKETDETVVLFDSNGETKTLDKADIVGRTTSKTSVMPDGLAMLMTKDEFADLVAYLMTLRGAPK